MNTAIRIAVGLILSMLPTAGLAHAQTQSSEVHTLTLCDSNYGCEGNPESITVDLTNITDIYVNVLDWGNFCGNQQWADDGWVFTDVATQLVYTQGWFNDGLCTSNNYSIPGNFNHWDFSGFPLQGGEYLLAVDLWNNGCGSPICIDVELTFYGDPIDCDNDGLSDPEELDCDGNGIPDGCDIAANSFLDQDQNGILDACEASGIFFVRNPETGRLYTTVGPNTWLGARAFGTTNNLHLATVEDEAMNTWLRQTFDLQSYWIGYHDAAVEGSFQWSSGRPVTYENWAPGAPNSFAPDQDYTAVNGATGEWDTYFSNTTNPAILETLTVDCDGDMILDDVQIAQDPGLDWNGDGTLDVCTPPNYCVGGVNSTGETGVMSLSGSPVAADNDLTLGAANLPAGQWSFFIMSQAQANVPGFGSSQGVLCLGPPIVRFDRSAFGEIQQTNAQGERLLSLDLTNLPQGVVFQPGESWNFQLWFRDQNPTTTSNTTDGVTVLFR